MEIVKRVTGILAGPNKEWQAIDTENAPHGKVLTSYVLIMALIPAVAMFIGYGLIGTSILGVKVGGSISMGISSAIVQYVSMVCGIYLTALIVNALATSFGAQNNFDKAFSLVAFAYTPMFVAGIFYILPSLSLIAMLAGLYSLYLLYAGMQPMMKAPADKQVIYFIICLIVMIAVSFLLSLILKVLVGGILLAAML